MLAWISPFSTGFHSKRKMATLAYEDIVVKPSNEWQEVCTIMSPGHAINRDMLEYTIMSLYLQTNDTRSLIPDL
jgi:hypothetical protein